MRRCNILYGKDKTKDPRRFVDLGVYDEMYHVWDLCFNDALFGKMKAIKPIKKIYYEDPEIPDRCLKHRFSYLVQTEKGEKTFVNILSDFKLPLRHRGFVFYLYNGKEKQTVSLIFDKKGEDICLHVDGQNNVHRQAFSANQKLARMVSDSLKWFITDEKAGYLHEAGQSYNLQLLLDQMKQPYHLTARRLALARKKEMSDRSNG